MQSNTARGRFGLMRPLPQSIQLTNVNRYCQLALSCEATVTGFCQ
jgi:hypothetical protein